MAEFENKIEQAFKKWWVKNRPLNVQSTQDNIFDYFWRECGGEVMTELKRFISTIAK